MYSVVTFCHNFINCILSWGVGVGQELSGTRGIKGMIEGSEVNTALAWNYPVPKELIKGRGIQM